MGASELFAGDDVDQHQREGRDAGGEQNHIEHGSFLFSGGAAREPDARRRRGFMATRPADWRRVIEGPGDIKILDRFGANRIKAA